MIYSLFIITWFLREIKTLLFWLYLWQLKEYHIGRFLDHFRTKKGKKLIFNGLLFTKLFLLSIFLLFGLDSFYLLLILLLIYFLESGKLFFDIGRQRIKLPVLTVKTFFLFLISLIFIIFSFLFIFFQDSIIEKVLFFDLITPLVISLIVLFFQPITVLWRNRVINKAKRKIDQQKDLLVIGITGSYGKTSTKEFLYKILSQKYNVLKTNKHQNSEIGIAQCVLNDLKADHDIFIVEMGAYNKGGIKFLTNIVKPDYGILTGLNEQHLATFGSLENIINTKLELIESLPKDGVAILNGSNNIIWNLKDKIDQYNNKLKKKIVCSVNREKSDFFAADIKEDKKNLFFDLVFKNEIKKVNLKLIGRQNIENCLLAIGCAQEIGMDLEEIIKSCNSIESIFGGVRYNKGINGVDILNSTYSSNPTGVITHLEHLKKWEGKRIIVMPCLIELGSSSRDKHIEIGKKIGEVCDLAIITTKDQFKLIQEGAQMEGLEKDKVVFVQKQNRIIEKLQDFFNENNVILLEGRISEKLKKELIQK